MGFRMRKLTAALTAVLFLAGPSFAEKVMEDVEMGGGMMLNSAYIWRAQNMVDGPVLQPSAYISYKGVRFDFWGNWDLTEQEEFTEIDYTWSYSTDLGFLTSQGEGFLDKVNVNGGYTLYTFPHLDDDDISNEVFVGIGLDTILNLSYTVYWDFDTGDGWYHEWGIGHSFDLDPIELNTGLSTGLNVGQWGYDTSLTALNFSGEVVIPLKSIYDVEFFKYVTISPALSYSLPLDDQYDDEFYGGIYIGVDF